MSSPLTERPLIVSPSLAATIGLEAALLYQLLADYFQLVGGDETNARVIMPREKLDTLLPFWDRATIDALLEDIAALDLLDLEPDTDDRRLCYHLGGESAAVQAAPPAPEAPAPAVKPAPRPAPRHEAAAGPARINPDWRPGQETLDYLRNFHNIGTDFVDAILPEFVHYWLERGEVRNSWSSAFNGWAVKRWKRHQQEQREQALTTVMSRDWTPDIDAVELLRRDGVPASFIEDAIPEFVLYWRDDGSAQRNWNMRFVEHIRRQWARYRNELGGETELKRIAADWQPSAAVFDILAMANIDAEFARGLVPEFVLYWRDSKQVHRSWNSKFLQHAKYRWANKHQWESANARQQDTDGQGGRSLDRGGQQFVERLTDTSWADDVPLEHPG